MTAAWFPLCVRGPAAGAAEEASARAEAGLAKSEPRRYSNEGSHAADVTADTWSRVAPQPSLAMKVLIVLGVVGLVLLVANGNIDFDYSSGSNDSAVASDEVARSATVRDVLAVIDTGAPAPTDLEIAQLHGLVRRVVTRRNRAATSLLEREWPQLSRHLDRNIGVLSARVARLPLTTRVGERCRAAAIRVLAHQRVVLRRFTRQIAREGATPTAVERLAAHLTGLPIDSCVVGASREDRAAIEAAFDG